MKILVNILCWLTALYCIYFPWSYFNKEPDRKTVKISHILVESKDEASEIKKSIDNKDKKFEEAVKEKSICPSADDNGNLGFVSREILSANIPELVNYSFNAQKNKLSDPIHSELGWHLVKVDEIKHYSDKENF